MRGGKRRSPQWLWDDGASAARPPRIRRYPQYDVWEYHCSKCGVIRATVASDVEDPVAWLDTLDCPRCGQSMRGHWSLCGGSWKGFGEDNPRVLGTIRGLTGRL